ncbi:SDR family NAD(P)-dependent oxidoreductase [Ochrobactrum sp. CM-21-5]|nr:SDR family NAD(P)-dependent oxidoreductase [Ochrobactrum sp. CM-21-5]MBC2883907.1 SDR family NAD(P)-dependent oxidoreductase [Ochrobactrum sp. CM-21-5]
MICLRSRIFCGHGCPKEGTIINIGPVTGRTAFANHGAYTAKKFAAHGLSMNLCKKLS